MWEGLFTNSFQSIERQIARIDEQICSRPSRTTRLHFAKSICCYFDPNHPETKRLIRKYAETRKEFTQFYKGQDFLELTLRQLTS